MFYIKAGIHLDICVSTYVGRVQTISETFCRYFWNTDLERITCRNLIKKTKQVRIKELENRDEEKRKARSYYNFLKRIF